MGKLIGIHGAAGSGKDTAANYLTEYRRRDFRTIAFAEPIRVAMRAIFGWDDSYFRHPKKNEIDPKFGISPRKAMQTLGTEWGRSLINTDLWLIIAGEKSQPMIDSGFFVLVTDCRFENEAAWIRKQGGVIWHIDRKAAAGAGTEGNHVSESGVKFVKGDKRIDNNETLGHFYDKVDALADELLEEAVV